VQANRVIHVENWGARKPLTLRQDEKLHRLTTTLQASRGKYLLVLGLPLEVRSLRSYCAKRLPTCASCK
jgi:hypothetical protein